MKTFTMGDPFFPQQSLVLRCNRRGKVRRYHYRLRKRRPEKVVPTEILGPVSYNVLYSEVYG